MKRKTRNKIKTILEYVVLTILSFIVGLTTLFALFSFPIHNANAEPDEAVPVSYINVHEDYSDEIDVVYDYDIDQSMFIEPADPAEKYFHDYSGDDVILLATLVYLEAGIENDECQRAVASVVLNRAIIAQATLEDIIYAPNQFTPASKIPYTTPSQRCIDNVEYVLHNGTTIPRYVTFFRADYYFDWGNRYKQYTQYDNTYFSYDVELYEKYQSGELS